MNSVPFSYIHIVTLKTLSKKLKMRKKDTRVQNVCTLNDFLFHNFIIDEKVHACMDIIYMYTYVHIYVCVCECVSAFL